MSQPLISSESITVQYPAAAPLHRVTVPYITRWSTEQDLPTTVVHHPTTGIAYSDETLGDRDQHGVLWTRTPSRPGHGRPRYGSIHPLRQRRAMRKLLCQVCARPADHSRDGILWLLQDHRTDWPQWPEQMAVTEPPICLPCVRTSTRLCPALRQGHVTIRARQHPIAAVYGVQYQPGRPHPTPRTDHRVALTDPAIRWTRAGQLIRQLHDCTIVQPD